MNKKVAILQSNYIPWKGYFDLINKADIFVIYDTVQYTKNDWRNRNQILSKNGAQWLTIPVRVSSLNQLIMDTKVADASWATKHQRAIKQNYSKSPFFKYYGESLLERIEALRDEAYLSKINVSLIHWFMNALEIETKIVHATEFELSDDRNSRLIEICAAMGASHYISGPAAKSYLDEANFEQNGIQVDWMTYGPYAQYEQPCDSFVNSISAVDTLFRAGNGPEYFFGKG